MTTGLCGLRTLLMHFRFTHGAKSDPLGWTHSLQGAFVPELQCGLPMLLKFLVVSLQAVRGG